MRIATNITREYLGGITRSNINFLDSIHGKHGGVVGIELNSRRYMQAPSIFRHYDLDWFSHHIINIHDLSIFTAIKRSKSIKDLEKKYKPIIKIIKTILIKDKPDVIFLNGTYYIPWLISIAAHELKIPIVLRYAGVYTKETENFTPKFKKFFNEMEKSFKKRVGHFIFPSHLCRDLVEKEIYKKSIDNAFVISNSFNTKEDTTVFRTAERRIAAVGRWDRIKNFKEFFEIHKMLKKNGWEHEASFVTSDSKIKDMPKSINRLATMTHEELLNFYSSQGLIICPSLFETFGNVPMEAVCMGIPVLVSDNMGCAEILKIAGLGNMVISFKDRKKVVERVQLLCGQQILPKQINNVRKILNSKLINAEIMAVLRDAAQIE
ncbi:MAG: Glycosyltransferase [Candidatus Yanofskybacteria bacterium GW2011_GWA1_39_13]|uniref:Glycosyltransferase n=1 Tax=Yanofskybacteria sp. (strain GW2011_GWA1_39_13) TaxID=1619019 RepID=A0A0G0PWA0_YANXG|nr:MAG: Glycosyltransferase [Candidatus Yanofskybacteria bacterium GW2011_GWA1_39_13]